MANNMKKKTSPWYRKVLAVLAIFAFAFIVGCSLPQLAGMWGSGEEVKEGPEIAKGEPVNILFLGIDARPGETNARSDTMMLACVDPELQKVAVISIPRDSRVDVPGSIDKINSANAVGGPKAACRAVEKLLDTNVDYYVLTNFNGFANMIDILGGVTIDVERNMKNLAEGINLKKGATQHLNGKEALAYVRFRDDALGDIGRTERQQKFLKAFAEEMLKTKTILKIPSLLPELKENVETNMGTKTMLDLAKMAFKFSPDNLVAQTLPGYFYDDPNNGLSYWIVDKKESRELIASLMDGRKVAVIQESPYPTVPKNRDKTESNNEPVEDPEEPQEHEEPGDGLPPDKSVEDPDTTPPEDPNFPGKDTNPDPGTTDPTDPGNNLGPEGYV